MRKKEILSKPNTEEPENNGPYINDAEINNMNAEDNEEAPDGQGIFDGAVIGTDDSQKTDETANTGIDGLQEDLDALKKELSKSQDKYLRMAAEFDNYRKRTFREKADLIQTAGESLLKDMLPLTDDFERGLELVSRAADMDAVRTGMELIYNKLKDFLTNHGVKEIYAINEPFDTDWHEAITKIPAQSDDMKGKIVDVVQKGYTLNDKVIRYPKVIVGE